MTETKRNVLIVVVVAIILFIISCEKIELKFHFSSKPSEEAAAVTE